jgi:ATP-dependent DNA helicase RecG
VHRAAEALLARDPGLADRVVDRWIGSAARYAGA